MRVLYVLYSNAEFIFKRSSRFDYHVLGAQEGYGGEETELVKYNLYSDKSRFRMSRFRALTYVE